MIAGVMKRLRNSGQLKTISAHLIHQRDTFSYWVDDSGEHVTFTPSILGDDRGPIIGIFAVANTVDGGVFVEVMSVPEIEKVRAVSRAKNSGPWVDWWEEMAKKTVIRRLAKRLPISSDAEQTISRDNEFFELSSGPEDETLPEVKSVKDLSDEVDVENTEVIEDIKAPEKVVAAVVEKKFTRSELGKLILSLSADLGWDRKRLAEWTFTNFAKETKALTDDEMLEVTIALDSFHAGTKVEEASK